MFRSDTLYRLLRVLRGCNDLLASSNSQRLEAVEEAHERLMAVEQRNGLVMITTPYIVGG